MGAIVLAGHGSLPMALSEGLSMILGPVDYVYTVSLDQVSGEEGLRCQFARVIEQIDLDEGVLVMTDILGGSPFKMAMELFGGNESVQITTGMNLPMLLSAAIENQRGAELVKVARQAIIDPSLVGEVGDGPEPSKAMLPRDTSRPHEIAAVRIDSRGIHGQVAAAWTPELKADRIVLIDDEAVKNDLQKSALRLARPEGVKLSILSTERAAQRLADQGSYPGERLFVVLQRVDTLVRLADLGKTFDTVIMGNVPDRPGTTEFTNTVRLTEEEADGIRSVMDRGTHFIARQVPKDPGIDFDSLLKE